jgi:hypothetical protein
MEDLQQKIIELMDLFDEGEVTTADKIDRPQRALDREAYDDFMKRNPMAGGGMLVQPSADGSRPGYARPVKSKVKMTVAQALSQILKNKKTFSNKAELKELVDQKTGLDISQNILKPHKYPALKKVTYDSQTLREKQIKRNIKEGTTRKDRDRIAKKRKDKKIKLFQKYLGIDIEIGDKNKLIGIDEDLRKKLDNASKRFRALKLNTPGLEPFNDFKFFRFFNNEYQTAEDRTELIAKKYGYTVDEWTNLDKKIKKRIYTEQYFDKMRIAKGEVPSGLSVDEIVDEVYKGKKIPGQGPAAKVLDTVYETLFRQEYDKLAEGGDPFSKADLSRNVEARLRELYSRPGKKFPEILLPGRTSFTESQAKSYYQYIDPRTQIGSKKSKIFSDYELELFDGNSAAALNKTANQQKIFDIITKGPVEIDELSKKLNLSPNRIRSEINRLLINAIVRVDKPVFLKGKEDLISNLVNNLEAAKTLDGEWNRSLKYIIYDGIRDPKLQAEAFNKIDEFDSILKIVQEKYPGLQVNYDHPASFTALKNQNFKQFLSITPIAKDINILKGRFDSQSNKNLLAMNDAKASGNNQLYDELLKKQVRLENTWSQLTGGQSTLGQIRIEGVEDFGTLRLDDPKKDLITEFKGNIKIRENIAKNLTEDIQKEIIEVLPRKDKRTGVIQTLERVTNPDLIKQDRAIAKELDNVLLKLSAQIDKDCAGAIKQASKDGGRIGLQAIGSREVCITKAKNYARDQVAKGIPDTGVKGSLIKRIFNATNNFVKSALDPKELFDIKKQFFSKAAIASLPIFDAGIAGYEALAMNKPIKEAISDTLTFGSIPRAMGIGMDRSEVIQAKNLLNNPNLSPAGKEYAQLIIDLGEYENLQRDATPLGITRKFNKFNELQNKIKNASTAGKFDYQSLLDETQATQLAKDEYSPLIGSLGDPLKNRAVAPRTGTRQGPGPVKIDLTPLTYKNFEANIPPKEDFDDYLRALNMIGQDQELTEEEYQRSFYKPAEFEQLMETPGFKGTQDRFATGGRAGFKLGDIVRKGVLKLIDDSVKSTPKDTTSALDKLIKKTLDEDFFDKKDRIVDTLNAKAARERKNFPYNQQVGEEPKDLDFYLDLQESNFKTKTGPYFDRLKARQNKAGGGLLKQAGDRSGPPPESGPNPQGLQGLLNRGKKI